MSGTFHADRVRLAVAQSLFLVSGVYRRRSGGELQFDGARPDEGWHAHGYFPRRLLMLAEGRVVCRLLWKRRWREPTTSRTCHSRPPDELASAAFCSLIVVVTLWAWLDGAAGLVNFEAAVPEPLERPSRRTLQRWLGRALVAPLAVQQAIREAIVERSEPRPVELLFPGGLSPPSGLLRRRWANPRAVSELWRGLALLIGGAIKFGLDVSRLLAEARGRTHSETFPI